MKTETPKHTDMCGHGIETYVGSFKYWRNAKEMEIYDLYTYSTTHGQEVCLRYGNEDSDYLSPGCLARFLGTDYDLYEKAVELIVQKGAVTWTRR